jgi:hypothetical protein
MSIKENHPSVWNTCVNWVENWPAFVAEVAQLMAKGLGITWKLHVAHHTQSSGKVEHINRILKSWLGKLCEESHLQGNQLLPIALLRVRLFPQSGQSSHPLKSLMDAHPP